MTGAARTPPPPATPARRTPAAKHPNRPMITPTVAKETAAALIEFAPPRAVGRLLDVIVACWTRLVARRLVQETDETLREMSAEPSDNPEASMEIAVAINILAMRQSMRIQPHAAGWEQRAAEDIDTKWNRVPPPFEAIRAEVYQAEAARLDAKKKGGAASG